MGEYSRGAGYDVYEDVKPQLGCCDCALSPCEICSTPSSVCAETDEALLPPLSDAFAAPELCQYRLFWRLAGFARQYAARQ